MKKPEIASLDREGELRRELERNSFICSILEFAETTARRGVEEVDPYIVGKVERAMKHFAESGGSASEAFTRLIGYGVLDEFPAIKELNIGRDERLPDTRVAFEELADGGSIIKATVYFHAALPDEEGRETWMDYSPKMSFCEALFTIRVPKEGFRGIFDDLGKRRLEVYKELGKYN